MLAWVLQSHTNAYIVAVTLVTSVWVYALRNRGFSFLALAMYFPGLFALAVVLHQREFGPFLSAVIFGQPAVVVSGHIMEVYPISALGLAVLIPIACVAMCGGISVLCGLAVPIRVSRSVTSDQAHDGFFNLFAGFTRAAGEELGWRCWLLPQLLTQFSPLHALLLSGIAWGTWPFPVFIAWISHFPRSPAE
jgi:uncharacterized protein